MSPKMYRITVCVSCHHFPATAKWEKQTPVPMTLTWEPNIPFSFSQLWPYEKQKNHFVQQSCHVVHGCILFPSVTGMNVNSCWKYKSNPGLTLGSHTYLTCVCQIKTINLISSSYLQKWVAWFETLGAFCRHDRFLWRKQQPKTSNTGYSFYIFFSPFQQSRCITAMHIEPKHRSYTSILSWLNRCG